MREHSIIRQARFIRVIWQIKRFSGERAISRNSKLRVSETLSLRRSSVSAAIGEA